MSKPFLSIERLTQKFPDGQGGTLTVFENATFGIEKGEFVCILGHSGCGKSTIMNILAGLAEPTSGVVKMDGYEVSGPSLDRGVVFQNYSLLPWLSALKNVTFGVKAREPGWSKAKVEEHARQYLAMVGLEGDVVYRKPSQLSGGMRQRVSIARAFANHPKLLLLDEPFGALDALTRGTIQDELLKIWSGTGQTVFMITHDIDEAILLADRILLMTNGPFARVAESVEITIPRPRSRTEIVEHPNYYAIRNHLVQFLGQRSKELAGQKSDSTELRPDTVRIDHTDAEAVENPETSPRLRAVNE
ncbi:ABC transporter ATP-binding protein [Lutimaribacter saemankumensis]|uniref:Nitrate/nitrite transport system ATP-binding protein n=1 Tax=Lutimaribacter saemankumensis TaxID=490829 RepID=A0A1G8GDM1_9RHOB|nr:ABC transporter ATP-binding protein [Lutimaribacter saemankumensis]SDH92483.1 nitrate/nitrite transport system ATP-binding protein [Lutimaribacter saemankumensis]